MFSSLCQNGEENGKCADKRAQKDARYAMGTKAATAPLPGRPTLEVIRKQESNIYRRSDVSQGNDLSTDVCQN
jgi:hypothetical protein